MNKFMPRPEQCAAEEVLKDEGVITYETKNRGAIIGCIACQLRGLRSETRPACYAYEIAKCTGLNPSQVAKVMRMLSDSGAMQTVSGGLPAHSPGGGPPRVYYGPSNTELGRQFFDKLEPPMQCDLEKQF